MLNSDDTSAPRSTTRLVGIAASKPLRYVVSTGYVLAGFVVACLSIHWLIGDPMGLYAEQRSEKLQVLANEGGGACSAIFGSSHVHNGFDPRVFDQELSSHGQASRSVNMAIEGGSQTEQFVMAKRFLSKAPQPAGQHCLVMLELNAGANFLQRHLVHPRAINIYDGQVAALSLEFAGNDISWPRRVGRSAFAFAATAMHYLNVGMLASKVLPRDDNDELLKRQSDFDRRGFLSEPVNAVDTAAVVEAFRTMPSVAHSVRSSLTHGNVDLVSRLMDEKGGKGVEYAYIVTPKLSDLTTYEEYAQCVVIDNRVVPVVNVARPTAFPMLYRQELWHDGTHLNEAGAAEYSKLIAFEMAKQESHPASADSCQKV